MTTHTAPTEAPAPTATPAADGRTRCSWVAGHPSHFAFHDAEWGAMPDTEEYARERLVLTCFQRDLPLAGVLDARDAIWDALRGCDLAQVAALDDAALDAIAARGDVPAGRARLAWIRDVAAAGAETAKQCKEFREYLLAVRWISREGQLADMTARFPGFDRIDAARLMENCGTGEGGSHERDCWRA